MNTWTALLPVTIKNDRPIKIPLLALNRREGQAMLVLEDPSSAAVGLDQCLGSASNRQSGTGASAQPMDLGRFLRLAINLAAGLDKLHRRGLMVTAIAGGFNLADSG